LSISANASTRKSPSSSLIALYSSSAT
jgi:hypothetical protein